MTRNEDEDDEYRGSPAPPGGCGDTFLGFLGAVILLIVFFFVVRHL
jgi:hypothetical protein